jgi:hypothetical protein
MNIDRMHIEFKVLLDKSDSSAYPNITTAEIDLFLGLGYERVIKNRYGRNNIYGKGFEEIQKRTDDLKQLVVTNYAAISSVSTETNTYRVDLQTLYSNEAQSVSTTEKYMFYLRGRARHVKSGCSSKYFSIRIVQQDDLEKILLDPFNNPTEIEAVGYFERGDLFIVTDGSFTVDRFKVTYIKIPLKIDKAQILSPLGLTGSSTIEVDEHLHSEIVAQSVNIALEVIESQRQVTQQQQLNKQE